MTVLAQLSELEPRFVRYAPADGHVYIVDVDTIAEAQGVYFLCPKCFVGAGRNNIGVHGVICWSESRGVPADAKPSGRWKLDGTSLADLTLNADPPRTARSVAIIGGCAWHGFITNGQALDA